MRSASTSSRCRVELFRSYAATVRTSCNEGSLVEVEEAVGGNDDNNNNNEDDGTTIALPVIRSVGNRVGMGKSLLVGRGGDGCVSNELAGDDNNIDGGMRDNSSDLGNPPSSPGRSAGKQLLHDDGVIAVSAVGKGMNKFIPPQAPSLFSTSCDAVEINDNNEWRTIDAYQVS